MAALKIGIMYEANQLSDITGVDLIGNCSKEYLKIAVSEFGFPQLLLDNSVDMKFHYIASSTSEPAKTTPDMSIVASDTYETAPRDLDILLIGGPPVSHRPAASLEYLKEAAQKTKIIMTTCVGSLWLADSGVLKGRKATTNRFAIPLAKERHPDVDWLDQRWVVDEAKSGIVPCTFWTAGGAGAGIDMIATYIQQAFHPGVANAACLALDFDPSARGQFYKGAMETGGFTALEV